MSATVAALVPRRGASPLWIWLAWVAVLLLVFRGTVQSMVTIWWHSETYTHAFLVPPIAVWLAWRSRAILAAQPVAPQPWFLLPLAGAAALWLAGELAAVQAATHVALVSMIVLSVPAALGTAIARAVLFPLLFLFFAVPFGEFLVPRLMDHTADFTVSALQFTGVPVYREGLSFVIPSGRWSVVEACSGIRYLIASFMVGTLFAYLNYRSTRRRMVFVAVSLVVPIVANWMRAYLIVMIGHLSGNQLAVGVDHLLYGWVFFGVVIALMFAIGARWTEPEAPSPSSPGAGPAIRENGWRVVAVGLAIAVWPVGHLAFLQTRALPPLPDLVLPQAVGPSWQRGDPGAEPWAPAFQAPRMAATAAYQASGREVGVWVGYYRQQGDDHKMVSSVNVLVTAKDPRWAQVRAGSQVSMAGARPITWRTAELRHANPLMAATAPGLTVWQTYWVGGRLMSGDARAKLWTAWDQWLGRGDDGAVILLHTAAGDDAEATLAAFSEEALPALVAELDQVRGAARP